MHVFYIDIMLLTEHNNNIRFSKMSTSDTISVVKASGFIIVIKATARGEQKGADMIQSLCGCILFDAVGACNVSYILKSCLMWCHIHAQVVLYTWYLASLH